MTSPEERGRLWHAKIEELKTVADSEGKGIDGGVLETVAAFNLNSFSTVQSCEGHLTEGVPIPWVEVQALNEPAEQYEGQEAIYNEVAQQYGLTSYELAHAYNIEALQQANERAMNNPETPAWQAWCLENEALEQQMQERLVEFYQSRAATPQLKLVVDANRYHAFKLHSASPDYDLDSTKLSDAERQAIAPRLRSYQRELADFTSFLKERYVSGG